MRIANRSLMGVLVLLGSGFALVQAQGSRIGFVDSQEILYQTNEGRTGLERLERYMMQKRQEFEAKNLELNQLQQDYQVRRGTLNPDALAEMERSLEMKQIELRRLQEDIQDDLRDRQERLLQDISQKVQGVIEEYAQQAAYDVIFMRDETQAWVSPSLDVTQEIIRLFNERHPGQGGSVAP
jgi:outer membrane protein